MTSDSNLTFLISLERSPNNGPRQTRLVLSIRGQSHKYNTKFCVHAKFTTEFICRTMTSKFNKPYLENHMQDEFLPDKLHSRAHAFIVEQ